MKQKSLTVVSGILGAAVFYVIYAAICGFIPSDTSQSAILLRALAEMCAAFGGICTLMLMGKSLVPTDSEGEFADEPSVIHYGFLQKSILRVKQLKKQRKNYRSF